MSGFPVQPPRAAVAHFSPVTDGLVWRPAPEGFSGAVVWRGDGPAGAPRVALKGWPIGTAPERVRWVHARQSRAAHLPFVPTVFTGTRGETATTADGRLWEACRWVPGAPRAAPTVSEVEAACEAVARLHLAWPAEPVNRPCAAVTNRLRALTHQPLAAPPRTLSRTHRELDALLTRAAREVARLAPAAVAALRPWAERAVSARPCVRDLRADHVLFRDGRVTGIVDYGALDLDTPAADLARLLGDFGNADPVLFGTGVRAYRRAGGPLDVPDEFVAVLASTGLVCSLLGWLVRCTGAGEPLAAPAAVATRLTHLLSRLDRTPRH